MCAPSAPPPPDYAGAAEATAAGDLENARLTTLANRPDIFSPEGSQTWQQGQSFDQAGYDQAMTDYNNQLATFNAQPPAGGDQWVDPADSFNLFKSPRSIAPPTSDSGLTAPIEPSREAFQTGNPDKWTGTVALNPQAQETFETNQRLQGGLASLGEDAVGQVGDLFSNRFSTTGEVPNYQGPEGNLPTYGENRQNVVDAMMSRVNTDVGRDRERTSAQLIAQGIPKGSEAYNREMEQLDRKQTDARQQAEISAQQQAGLEYQSALQGRGVENQEGMADYTTGLDTRRQGIQEALLNRQTPLNEISAFRTGSQVGMPQFQPYGNQSFTGGPDIFGATQAQSQFDIAGNNAQQAGRNNLLGGLFGLGAGGLAGGYF